MNPAQVRENPTSQSFLLSKDKHQYKYNHHHQNQNPARPKNVTSGSSASVPSFPKSASRRRKVVKDNILGITRPSIRRLARRGGIKRMKVEIHDEIRNVLVARLREILRITVSVVESGASPAYARKTITSSDVVYALRKLGTDVYGFGGGSIV